MSSNQHFVVIGGGLGGAKIAEALRANDFDGRVTLLAAEEELPYERPPLSKQHLAGTQELPDFTVDTAAWYRDHHIDLRLGTTATAFDPIAKTVTLPDGSTLDYDKLALATGSRAAHASTFPAPTPRMSTRCAPSAIRTRCSRSCARIGASSSSGPDGSDSRSPRRPAPRASR